jgi:hypothetical protein
VIRHLPSNTPAEDIPHGLVSLGFDVISVKQMTSTRRSPAEGTSQVKLPLFLIPLPRTEKSQEIYKLDGLCHISIKVEAYKAQTGLTQCYNCKSLATSRRTADNLHVAYGMGAVTSTRSAPRRGTKPQLQHAATASWLTERNLIRPNYRGCSHVRDEMRNRKAQRTPKTTTGRLFSSHYTTQGVSFAAAL